MPPRSRTAKRGFSRASTTTPKPRRGRDRWIVPIAALFLVGAGAAAVFFFWNSPDEGEPVSWTRLGTPDVHSLAFDPADPAHLYFGHHGGLLESRDGGRSWQPTALSGADAMNVRVSEDGLMQIAGHEVYLESRDGGQTWEPVPNDLPGLDLHTFVTDPADPTHAWAFAAGHGLFETTDAGRHWGLRLAENIGALTVFEAGGEPVLVGLTQKIGLGRSDDGGRTWEPLGSPPGQLASLAVASDGSVLYAGTTDGLQRSTDGGTTWSATGVTNLVLAIAVAPGDDTVAVVDDDTRFFRSPDGGTTWPGPN